MDYAMDMSCVIKVNRNCEICRQKVTEIMHCVNVVYSVDFVGEDNTIKLKGRANPNMFLAVIDRYGDHGKVSNLHFEDQVLTPRGGGGYYSQSGYYAPSTAADHYAYPYSYPPAPPPHFFAGNYAYPMANPPRNTEAPHGMKNQHTAPPHYTQPPPPPRPLHSYAYIEPPYWPTTSSDAGWCVIM